MPFRTRKDGTVTDKNQKRPPILSFRPQRKRSGGIHHVAEMYQHKVKSATWEDSSTPFHYARNDMIGGVVLFIYTGYNCNVTERHIGRSLQ